MRTERELSLLGFNPFLEDAGNLDALEYAQPVESAHTFAAELRLRGRVRSPERREVLLVEADSVVLDLETDDRTYCLTPGSPLLPCSMQDSDRDPPRAALTLGQVEDRVDGVYDGLVQCVESVRWSEPHVRDSALEVDFER